MSASTFESVIAVPLGIRTYEEGLALQLRYHERVRSGELPGVILFLQHTPVLTLGKNADPSLILASEADLREQGVDRVATDRGGEVTAHMPGQLVIYPILPLQRMRLPVKSYVEGLQRAVIQTLKRWNLHAICDSAFPGVWIGSNKICAVGVRIRERVSMHGIALNVNNSLDLFTRIIPCGIRDRGVTSMAHELQGEVDMDEVLRALSHALSQALQVELHWVEEICSTDARLGLSF